jgi:hypothetical protein
LPVEQVHGGLRSEKWRCRMSTPGVLVAAEDAVELAELLEFVRGWLTRSDAAGAFERFVGDGFDVEMMRGDLARFVFLLGGAGDGLAVGDEERW